MKFIFNLYGKPFFLLFSKWRATSISLPQVQLYNHLQEVCGQYLMENFFFCNAQVANPPVLKVQELFLQFLLKIKMTFFYLFKTMLLIGLAFLIYLLSRQSKKKGLPFDIIPKITQPGIQKSWETPQMSFCLFCLNFVCEYVEPQENYIIKFSITTERPFGESKKNEVRYFILLLFQKTRENY